MAAKPKSATAEELRADLPVLAKAMGFRRRRWNVASWRRVEDRELLRLLLIDFAYERALREAREAD